MINIHSDLLDKLKGDELAVFCQIIRHINKDNKCFPSKHTLQNLTGYGREKLAKTISNLQSLGIIKTHQSKSDGKFSKTIYTILTDKAGVYITVKNESLEDNEKPEPINRDTAFRTTEKPSTGNQPLSIVQPLSIDQSNTLLEKEVFYKDSKEFLLDWNTIRSKALKKPSNINRLARAEQPDFNELRSEYTRNEFRNGITALFKQDVINFDDMQMRPKHFLKYFEKYQTAFDEKSVGLYGRKPKESRL